MSLMETSTVLPPVIEKKYFFVSSDFKNLLFEGLDIHGAAGIVAICIFMCCVVLLLEATKAIMFYVTSRLRQNPLTYGHGQTDTSINQDRIRFHVTGCLLHVLNMILAYLVMLAVMSYDAYILIAVLVGASGGYFIFGAITASHRHKFMSLHAGLQRMNASKQGSQATLVTTD